jgi:C4-dicarboxylate-specific signal transduction histidine kinase
MSGDDDSVRELQISTETDETEGVRVGVRDTGRGLAPESLPRLFEPFYPTKAEGMGMGLAICRSAPPQAKFGRGPPHQKILTVVRAQH